MRSVRTIAVTVMLGLAVLVVPGCSSTSTSTSVSTAAASAPSAAASSADEAIGDFPASLVQNFMDACVAAGATQDQCSCSMSEIRKRFTLAEFTALDLSVQAGAPDEQGMAKLGEAQAACLR